MISRYAGEPLLLLCMVIVILVSMTFHEYAHAFVAYKSGDYTPRADGRLTLNPLRHIDLFGFFMLMAAGFGFAKPVRINPINFRDIKKGIFLTAIAGVTVNLAFTFVSIPLSYLFWFLASRATAVAAYEVCYFFTNLFFLFSLINVNLVVFNLLPIYPLDGFRVVESFTRHNNPYVQFMIKYGLYILLALVLLGVLIDLLNTYMSFNIPEWLDFLSSYIRYARYIIWPIDKLWTTIFKMATIYF